MIRDSRHCTPGDLALSTCLAALIVYLFYACRIPTQYSMSLTAAINSSAW